MKRDHDYLRELLFELEGDNRWIVYQGRPENEHPEAEKRYSHLLLLADAGFVDQWEKNKFRITLAGHDYIDAIRSDTIWKKTKSGAAQIGGATLGMMFDLAKAYLKQEAAEKLGINL